MTKKEVLILQLLEQHGEMYGLDMVLAAPSQLKRGTIYVALGQMAAKGFVDSRQEPGDGETGGLPRRVYRATPRGGRALRDYSAGFLGMRPEPAL